MKFEITQKYYVGNLINCSCRTFVTSNSQGGSHALMTADSDPSPPIECEYNYINFVNTIRLVLTH